MVIKMNAPFGIIFLKKVELFNLLKDLRKKSDTMIEKHTDSPNPVTWYVEEKILKWTYHGHKYLTTSIKLTDFDIENPTSKMKDFELLDNNNKIISKYLPALKRRHSIFKNIVARGFAIFESNEPKSMSIIINNEGLLLGEVIYKSEHGNFFLKNIYRLYAIFIDYIGALILIILFLIPTLTILIYNFINIIKSFFNS